MTSVSVQYLACTICEPKLPTYDTTLSYTISTRGRQEVPYPRAEVVDLLGGGDMRGLFAVYSTNPRFRTLHALLS